MLLTEIHHERVLNEELVHIGDDVGDASRYGNVPVGGAALHQRRHHQCTDGADRHRGSREDPDLSDRPAQRMVHLE